MNLRERMEEWYSLPYEERKRRQLKSNIDCSLGAPILCDQYLAQLSDEDRDILEQLEKDERGCYDLNAIFGAMKVDGWLNIDTPIQ